MDKFWKLLKESVIVQGTITLILVCSVVYLAVVGRPVPDELSAGMALALGYYFGSKAQMQIQSFKEQ